MKQDSVKMDCDCCSNQHQLAYHGCVDCNKYSNYRETRTMARSIMDALKDRLSNIEIDKLMDDMLESMNIEQRDSLIHSDVASSKLASEIKAEQGEDDEDERGYYIWQDFQAASILKDGPCEREFNRFVKRFGYFDYITQDSVDAMVKEGEREWLDWLESHEYIQYGKKSESPSNYELRAFGKGEPYCGDDELCRIVVVDKKKMEKIDGGNVLSIKLVNRRIVVHQFSAATTMGLFDYTPDTLSGKYGTALVEIL